MPPEAPAGPSHGGAARVDPAETPTPHPTMSGFPHGCVADLQWRLNTAGATPPLRIDGQAGVLTRDAIAAFQVKHGLIADGRIGVKLWGALTLASGA